ncbi:MAG: CRISPR-associated endonuclease Cas3'', partial [Nannocystaceae bacterium]
LATAGRDRRLMLGTNAAGEPTWTVAVLSSTRAAEATTEDVVSVFTGIEVSLPEHLADVRAWAHAFATAAGLDSAIADDVALAALLHDLGKADPRFQAMLRGGDPIATAAGPALAKSRQFGSAAARQRAQDRSGWPPGLRHELVSLALLDASEPLRARAHDLDLVRHLVASHHGWCRPWIPALIDPEPTLVRVRVDDIETEVSTAAIDDDFGVECAARFHRLCRRYGWHGLAYLEALLRLGDHRASAVPGARPEASP